MESGCLVSVAYVVRNSLGRWCRVGREEGAGQLRARRLRHAPHEQAKLPTARSHAHGTHASPTFSVTRW